MSGVFVPFSILLDECLNGWERIDAPVAECKDKTELDGSLIGRI